jgi:hypothetical protein
MTLRGGNLDDHRDVRVSHGYRGRLFQHARLQGSWNGWTVLPMTEIVADDGCPAITRIVEFDDDQAGRTSPLKVRLDGPPGPDRRGIAAVGRVSWPPVGHPDVP